MSAPDERWWICERGHVSHYTRVSKAYNCLVEIWVRKLGKLGLVESRTRRACRKVVRRLDPDSCKSTHEGALTILASKRQMWSRDFQ